MVFIVFQISKHALRKLAEHPERVAFADLTGFSPEGVGRALAGLSSLERNLTASDWTPESLFGDGSGMADLYGVMLRIPQLSESLKDIQGEGNDYQLIADITKAWVGGRSIQEIARDFFHGDENQTKAITDTCKAIYRNLTNTGTWGLSALSRLSGVDFDSLSEAERRRINALPAMIYHGVKTEEAVLMRMNSVPRSIAEKLGVEFRNSTSESAVGASVQQARAFLKQLDATGWERVRPEGAHLSGSEYKSVWELLSGERR